MDDYITAKEFAEKWKVSEETVRDWCRKGKLVEERHAEKVGGRWRIPKGAKPPTGRGGTPDKPPELVTK